SLLRGCGCLRHRLCQLPGRMDRKVQAPRYADRRPSQRNARGPTVHTLVSRCRRGDRVHSSCVSVSRQNEVPGQRKSSQLDELRCRRLHQALEDTMTRMKALGLMLAGLSLSLTAASASPRHEDVLSEMFAWWNQAFKSPGAFTENAFRRYFTEDAAIVLNGKESSKGIPELTAQFKRIQSEGGSVEIVLPFREGFQSGDKIFTYHFIRIERN